MQKKLGGEGTDVVARTRRATDLPVALGFGISTPEQARTAAGSPDAVVVGSAIVDRIYRAPKTRRGLKDAVDWVGTLVKAVKEV